MEKKNIGVYIGRFQPLHNAHLNTIMAGLMTEDHFIVVIGGANRIDEKNPYPVAVRKEFILQSVNSKLISKLSLCEINDVDDENLWYHNLNNLVLVTINNTAEKCTFHLYGAQKDILTNAYLNKILEKTVIKTHKFISVEKLDETIIHATTIREILTEKIPKEELLTKLCKYVPKPVAIILMK